MKYSWNELDARTGFPLHLHQPVHKIAPMTVAAGAICEDGSAGIIVADKMLCVNDCVPVEADCCKIVKVSEKVFVAWAGDKDKAQRVIEKVKDRVASGSQQDFSSVLSLIVSEVEALRAELLSRSVPRLKELLSAFAVIPPQHLQYLMSRDATLQEIDKGIMASRVDADFLLLGVDDSGQVRLCTLEGQIGYPMWHEEIGFATTGSGAVHASVSLSASMPIKKASLEEAALALYSAKRCSELALAVGKGTDMAVMVQGEEPRFIPSASLDALNSIREKRKLPGLSAEEVAAIRRVVRNENPSASAY